MTAVIVDLAAYRAAKAATAVLSPEEVPLDEAITICLSRRMVLTAWEKGFLVSIRQSNRMLSPKQQVVMQQIFDKVCGATDWETS